jgi:hypothetical protein
MVFDFPNNTDVKTYIGGMGTTGWNTWTKPMGFSNAIIIGCGGGGGGGGDVGSGGGGGGWGHIYCPLLSLPDTLYVQVGVGALQGNPSNGGSTIISTIASTAYPFSILMTCGGGGGGRRLGIPGIGGGVSFGILTPGVYMGFNGGDGASVPVGPSLAASIPPSGSPIYGGSSGCYGLNSPGRWVTTAQSWFLPLPDQPVSGSGGFIIKKPFFSFGGGGGGEYAFGLNTGGNGFFGSGGGGSGESSGATIGGNGFAIIICY